MIEVEFDDRVICLDRDSLCKLQAAWRGTVTRKHFAQLQHHYLQLVKDMEQNDDLQVSWKFGALCLPSLISKKKLRATAQSVQGGRSRSTERQSQAEEAPKQEDKSYQTDDNTILAVATDNEKVAGQEEIRRECSVVETSEALSQSNDNSSKGVAVSPHETKRETEDKEGYGHTIDADNSSESHESDKRSEPEHESVKDRNMNEVEDEFITMLNDKKHEVSEEELESTRAHVAMELLWVQQAIASRKQYLRLRDQMVEATPDS